MNYECLSRVSLLIVTWNGDDLLKDCLDSLVSVYGCLPETVIVDNANQQSTRELTSNYPNTTYIPLPENRGFAGGNNAGIDKCTKEYVVLLNNDTRFTDDSISPLVDFLDSHPKAAAAQGTIILASRGVLDGCGAFISPIGVLAFRGCFTAEFDRFTSPEKVFSIGGAFFAIRRCSIPATGLFYDHFNSYYEEIDLCCRLYINGWECWYVPTPPILHVHYATAKKIGQDKILRQYYRNIKFSTKTCFGPWGRFRIGAPLFLLSVAQSLFALMKGNTVPFKAHLHAFTSTWHERHLIRKTRNDINAERKISDRQLLNFAIKSQPWSYYLCLVKRG